MLSLVVEILKHCSLWAMKSNSFFNQTRHSSEQKCSESMSILIQFWLSFKESIIANRDHAFFNNSAPRPAKELKRVHLYVIMGTRSISPSRNMFPWNRLDSSLFFLGKGVPSWFPDFNNLEQYLRGRSWERFLSQ